MANIKTVKWSIGGIAAVLASLVAMHQSIDYIADSIVYPYIEPKVDTTIAKYLKEHPQGDMTGAVGLSEDILDMFNRERGAFLNIIKSSHLMNWNHMRDTIVKGYHLKHQDGVFYSMKDGMIFEATYRRSVQKFFIVDGYDMEYECIKNP